MLLHCYYTVVTLLLSLLLLLLTSSSQYDSHSQVYNLNKDNQTEGSEYHTIIIIIIIIIVLIGIGLKIISLPSSCSSSTSCSFSSSAAQLDLVGFNVMKKFIYAVETRGFTSSSWTCSLHVVLVVVPVKLQCVDSAPCRSGGAGPLQACGSHI